MSLQNLMKKAVAESATNMVKNGMIVGLGSGSTAALMIEALGEKISSGELENIYGVPTSFQSEVLAQKYKIPLIDLASVNKIDIAIDGADEVDPNFQLIKGGGACHVREKLVACRADKFVIVVDETKLVDCLNLDFKLPVEVLPSAWKQIQLTLNNFGGESVLRMAEKKAGPVVTDQGNLVLDVSFASGIIKPKDLEQEINNIPGVLENGLFVDLANEVLVGKIVNDQVKVEQLIKTP
tara:strand:- start:5334 stop:6047 length:714 start_codon:yes stop_codon:yes gene_type:complete